MIFQPEISTPYSYASFVNSMVDADKEVWLNDTRADFAFRMAYDKADDEGKKQLFELPNFNADIFEEISGIDVREDYKRLMK